MNKLRELIHGSGIELRLLDILNERGESFLFTVIATVFDEEGMKESFYKVKSSIGPCLHEHHSAIVILALLDTLNDALNDVPDDFWGEIWKGNDNGTT